MKIIHKKFPRAQYYPTVHQKVGIDLHHTASGKGSEGDINWWKSTPEHVATPYIIERNGNIIQLYDDFFWAHRLGIKDYIFDMHFVPKRRKGNLKQNTWLNQRLIGIEMDSWGGLVKVGDEYRSWTGEVLTSNRVIYYPKGYRGFYYFERYTQAQIDSLYDLIARLIDRHCLVDLNYDYDTFFDVSREALLGNQNLISHASVRHDKSDCHPQPELITMLKLI